MGKLAKVLEKVNQALDMSKEARMKRSEITGHTKDLYHATYADIDEIDPYLVDIGTHLGTIQQATNRLKDTKNVFSPGRSLGEDYREGANIIPIKARLNKPLELNDVGDWSNSYQVLSELRSNPNFADKSVDIEDMLQEADEIMPSYAYAETSWNQSPENRELLDEARSLIKEKGYDSVKYLNQVENTYGSTEGLNKLGLAQQSTLRHQIKKLDDEVRSRMPQMPNNPDDVEGMRKFLDAKNPSDFMSADELKKRDKLMDELMQIDEIPDYQVDPHSYIALDPNQIRSVHAAFDPAKKDRSNLLAGIAGTAIAADYLFPEKPLAQDFTQRRASKRDQWKALRERTLGAHPLESFKNPPVIEQTIEAPKSQTLLDIASAAQKYNDFIDKPLINLIAPELPAELWRKQAYGQPTTLGERSLAALAMSPI